MEEKEKMKELFVSKFAENLLRQAKETDANLEEEDDERDLKVQQFMPDFAKVLSSNLFLSKFRPQETQQAPTGTVPSESDPDQFFVQAQSQRDTHYNLISTVNVKNLPSDLFIEGRLLMKSNLKPEEFLPYHVVLESKILMIYKANGMKNRRPKFFINFDLNRYVLKNTQPYSPCFEIDVPESTLFLKFKAETFEQKLEWIYYLNLHLNNSAGKNLGLTLAQGGHKWWKTQEICNSQFVKMVDHCDILLFRSKNFNIQRLVLNSEYDHVGLLFRDPNDKILVIEATGNLGVHMSYWDRFVERGWVRLYDRLAYRKLRYARDSAFIDRLAEFIEKNNGKKYSLGAKKLMKQVSQLPEEGVKEYESFFCSELVAAIYKAVGLIDPTVACSTYYPKSFSDSSSFELLNGAVLEAEMVLNFNE
jgi:hypothetical protein